MTLFTTQKFKEHGDNLGGIGNYDAIVAFHATPIAAIAATMALKIKKKVLKCQSKVWWRFRKNLWPSQNI